MCVQITHQGAYNLFKAIRIMGRMYLNRNKNEEFEQDYAEEIEATKKKIERIGPQNDVLDPLEVSLRQIAIEKDLERPKTKEEKVKEEIKEAGHQTRTTNQYQKFINAHIEDRVSKIEQIKHAKSKFDKDIENLREENVGSVKDLTKLSVQNISTKSLDDMLQSLLTNLDITKSKLEYFKNKVISTEQEVLQHENNIQKIKDEITRKRIEEEEKKKRAETIKKELQGLSSKYNLDELKKVFDTLNKSNSEEF